MDASDEALIRDTLAAMEGDTAAFSELVRRHQATVLANCRYLTRSREDAEDLAQEVFVKVFFKLATFEQRSRFSTWLQRIKVNHCLNFLKTKRGKSYLELSDAETKAEPALRLDDSTSSGLEQDQERARIRAVLDSLPDSLRVPLVLCDVDGLSYAEIQARLGLGLSATKMRIARAREEFRRRFARITEEAGVPAGDEHA